MTALHNTPHSNLKPST